MPVSQEYMGKFAPHCFCCFWVPFTWCSSSSRPSPHPLRNRIKPTSYVWFPWVEGVKTTANQAQLRCPAAHTVPVPLVLVYGRPYHMAAAIAASLREYGRRCSSIANVYFITTIHLLRLHQRRRVRLTSTTEFLHLRRNITEHHHPSVSITELFLLSLIMLLYSCR